MGVAPEETLETPRMKDSAPPAFVPKEHFPSSEFMSLAAEIDFFREPHSRRSQSFFWARNALYYSLKALGISRGAQVLLPAYLCKAAVEPFEAFGAKVQFYGVDRRCQPDFSEIEAKISPRTEAVLAVHYFGFPQRMSDFRAICDRNRLALIEDCAHVLKGCSDGQPLGTFGDASVFSWRKFLPVYDGGELWLKSSSNAPSVDWASESIPFTLKVAKSLVDRVLENSSFPAAKRASAVLESVGGLAKRLRGFGKSPVDAPLFALDSEEASFDPSVLNRRMSRLSRWLRKHSNVTAIVARRQRNFEFLQKELQWAPGFVPLHQELSREVCPWIFPAFFEGIDRPHLRLQDEGVPAVNWEGVRPASLRPGAFPVVDSLYQNLVFLPVHQNLASIALDAIVRAVRKVCANSTAACVHV
jgi:perosamine synthetase